MTKNGLNLLGGPTLFDEQRRSSMAEQTDMMELEEQMPLEQMPLERDESALSITTEVSTNTGIWIQ